MTSHCKNVIQGIIIVFLTACFAPPVFAEDPAVFESLSVGKTTVLANNSDLQTATLQFRTAEPDTIERVSVLINYLDDSGNPNRGYLSWYKSSGFKKEGGYGSEFINLDAAESAVVLGTDTISVTFAWTSRASYGGVTDNDIAYYYVQYGEANGWLNHDTNFDVVTAILQPTVMLEADPLHITAGDPAVLSWITTDADTCEIQPGVGSVEVNGSLTVYPVTDTTYTITATGAGGTATDSVTITVEDLRPVITLSANPASIPAGGSAVLSFSSMNAYQVYLNQGIGEVGVSGSVTVTPEYTTIYTATAIGPNGTASAQVTVSVEGAPAPQPEGSFGDNYDQLIPPDATLNEYDPQRFSVARGQVKDNNEAPLAEVRINVLGRPDYGTAITDMNGEYSLPVEGGSTLNISFQKTGFITAHRKVEVLVNDIAVVETPVLLPEDQAATQVVLDGDPQTVLKHESTPVSDSFGTRRATVVLSGDNQAFVVDENGNDLFALNNFTVRATEFVSPESMPAILPPTSAFTYCVELTADGFERVRFSEPVAFWVDNFLGFDVGDIVPVGYYDRDQGRWIPSENGKVVRLLDENGDGVVDALDADGDNLPDDLNNNGNYADEVKGLDDPSQYSPGSTYWRQEITHFSPWDCNWPVLVPLSDVLPNPEGEISIDQPKPEGEDCETQSDSYVSCRSRVYHEDVPVAGTGLTLHYASSRVDGYKTVIRIPVSGATVPPSLIAIPVRVTIAGRQFDQTLPPSPDQSVEVVWDGLDFLGQPVTGTVNAKISIGFVYSAVYIGFNGDIPYAVFGGTLSDPTNIVARQNVTVNLDRGISWDNAGMVIHSQKHLPGMLAEGWTLSDHHYMTARDSSALYKGNGILIETRPSIIDTAAGTGQAGYSGDSGPGTEARVNYPEDTAIDGLGNVYIADTNNHRVRKVTPNGIITTVAGSGNNSYGHNFGGDGGPALDALLYYPSAVAVDGEGNLFIADKYNHRIRKVDTNGIITTFAGNGGLTYSGDGGPATEASFFKPAGVAVDQAGNVYLAADHRVRKVDVNGIIPTVAGTGTAGFGGDEGLAVAAMLNAPQGLTLDSYGNLYVADNQNRRVRKINTSGIITTVAGSGGTGAPLDGGPATEAAVCSPCDVAFDSHSNLFIADYCHYSIRKVDATGIITTVAGTGTAGFSGDGDSAMDAQMSYPYGVAVDARGRIYIADRGNQRIRQVSALQDTAFSFSADPADIQFLEEGAAYVFSPGGLHKQTIDIETGKVLAEFGYDSQQLLVTAVDRFGNQTVIERDAEGLPTAVVSPDGIRTELVIDAGNHLTGVRYPDNSTYAFQYTADGLMTKETEPNGNFFTHTFDANGRITDVEDQEGGHTQLTRQYLTSGEIITNVTTAEGSVTSYQDLIASTGAMSSVITSSASDLSTLYSGSADGLSAQKTLPDGSILDFELAYDPQYKFEFLKKLTATTPAGLTGQVVYNRLYEDTNADGKPDRITRAVAVNGKTSSLVNDTLAGQRTVTTAAGRSWNAAYDPNTLLISTVHVPGLLDTNYQYDPRGRLVQMQTGSRSTTISYDGDGNVESVLDPQNRLTTFEYDALGRTTAVHRPDSTDMSFSYDANGNMTVLTNPSGIDHDFEYNLANLPDRYNPPLSGSIAYTYDRDRRLTHINFPSGNEIVNVYTGEQLTQIQTPEGNVALSYYPSGQAQAVGKAGEQIAYGYDGSLVVSQGLTGTLNQTLSYTYNNDFNLTGFTYAGTA
ncbi:MAG: hypothetical protein WC450_03135, partial [Candidatus Omnitrophota bacterium]